MENRVEVLGRPSRESDIEPRLKEARAEWAARTKVLGAAGICLGVGCGWFGWNEVTAGGGGGDEVRRWQDRMK